MAVVHLAEFQHTIVAEGFCTNLRPAYRRCDAGNMYYPSRGYTGLYLLANFLQA